MLRLFTALHVPDDIAACLTPLQAGLPGARWVPRENFHITLKFLGKVREPDADDIDETLSKIKSKPFTLRIEGLGSFGDKDRPRSVYAAITRSEPLERLAEKIAVATTPLIEHKDKRKFIPHITLGRMNSVTNRDAALWIERQGRVECPEFHVTDFSLYSTLTHPKGSVYMVERHYVF